MCTPSLIAGNGSRASHQSGTRNGIRNGTKVEKTIETDYGEIKAFI